VTDSNTVAPVNDEPSADSNIPRGALVVVAIGLLACVVAAVASTDKSSGSSAEVEWVQEKAMPDSRPVTVPGGKGKMQLVEAALRATGVNEGGYSLYRSSATLRIDAGTPIGSARIRCAINVPKGTEVAQTPGSRASYPRSSDDLFHQEVPEVVLALFSSHGAELGVLEFGDLFESGFSSERDVKVEWPEYKVGEEAWEWFLPPGKPKQDLVLPFASVWKTTKIPAASVACEITTGAGKASVATSGGLDKRTEAINEDEETDEDE
jgi:hypothetical protein